MATKKEQEPKQMLEREYIVPLRKGWLKVPKYKRTNKAVKTLKEFIARHMKIYDNDLRKIKIDIVLNNEIRFRGIKKPPAIIKVKAKKFEDGIVRVELVEIPKHIEFARLREKKKIDAEKKVKEEKVDEEKKAEEKIEEEKKDDKKKEEAGSSSKDDEKEKKEETGKKEEKTKAKGEVKIKPKQDQKNISKDKDVRIQRKALSR